MVVNEPQNEEIYSLSKGENDTEDSDMDLMAPMSNVISKLSNSDIQSSQLADTFDLSVDFANDVLFKAGNSLEITSQIIIDMLEKESIEKNQILQAERNLHEVLHQCLMMNLMLMDY